MLQCLFWWATTVKKYPVFTSSTHFQGTLIKTEYILTDLRKKRRRTVRNQHLLSVIVLLPLFVFFYFSTKKKLYSLLHSEKFGFAFAKFTSTSRLFFSSLYIVQKWLLLNLVCLQSRPLLPHVGWFSPAYCFTYIYSFVSFFFCDFLNLFSLFFPTL